MGRCGSGKHRVGPFTKYNEAPRALATLRPEIDTSRDIKAREAQNKLARTVKSKLKGDEIQEISIDIVVIVLSAFWL